MGLKIVIAGGTGFVGRALIRALAARGHEVVPLIRPGSESKLDDDLRENALTADPARPLENSGVKADALINAVGIIREFPSRGITFQKIHLEITQNLVEFARENGIERFVQISALGVGPDGKTGYQRTKFEAEEYIRKSGLRWSILRPSMIIGPGSDAILLFARMIRWLPVVPVIGDGNYKQQPVALDDLVAGLAVNLNNDEFYGQIFEIGGPEILTFNKILDEIGAAMKKRRVRKIHQPVWLIRTLASPLGRFRWFPVTGEQINMLLEGNFTAQTSFFELAGIKPRPISAVLDHMF